MTESKLDRNSLIAKTSLFWTSYLKSLRFVSVILSLAPEKQNLQDIPQSGETDDLISQQFRQGWLIASHKVERALTSTHHSHLSPKWKNWWIRITMSWLMLFFFIFVGYLGPIAIVLLVLAIQIKCFHEVSFTFFDAWRIERYETSFQIITIGYMVYRNYELPWFRTISWYFLFCANYFFYGETINEYFGSVLEVFLLPLP